MVQINRSTRSENANHAPHLLSPSSSWRFSSLRSTQMLIFLVVLMSLVGLKANLFFTDQFNLRSNQNSIQSKSDLTSNSEFTQTPVDNNSGNVIHWKERFTEILKDISLPKWTETSKNNSENNRLGDIWLPPRLSIADDLRTLQCGVLFCGTGSISFAKRQMVPMINYLRDNLGIPDAHERSSMRKKGIYNAESKTGYALVTTKEFVNGPLKNLTSFFDAVYLVEDLPLYPYDWQIDLNGIRANRAIKVHAMSAAPFDTTLFLDFDSLPCHKDFTEPLLDAFSKSNADIGFTSSINMYSIMDDRHYLVEHNSAVVMLNMTSIRTRVLLSLYVQAFQAFGRRDQPPLMVAMQAMVEKFHLLPSEVPNESVREVIETYNLGFIRHLDFDASHVCRKQTEVPAVCSADSSCVIAHKDENTFLPKSKEWKNADGIA